MSKGKMQPHIYRETGEDDLFAYAVQTPIYSIKVSYEIACYDKDGDGYFNWGISLNKPPACPSDSPEEEDCDDSNPNLGPIHADGRCTLLTEAYRLSASKRKQWNYQKYTLGYRLWHGLFRDLLIGSKCNFSSNAG